MANINRNLILVSGPSASGKTASLKDLKNPKGVVYFNCESGKELPFKSQFQKGVITHPTNLLKGFKRASSLEDVHTIVIDSLTYLMDMYESQIVLKSDNTMKGWSKYAQYFKKLMQEYVATSSKNVIFTAHTSNVYNESDMVNETMVKIKGSIMNNGVESYFGNVISTKKMALPKLESYKNPLLTITDDDKARGIKYVFQTQLNKDTVHERMRGPMGMWDRDHTFIDNNLQNVLDHLHNYYK